MKFFALKKTRAVGGRPSRRHAAEHPLNSSAWVLRGCALVLFVLALGPGAEYLKQSSFFELKELKIFGCHITSPDGIISYARINKGMNLLSINLANSSSQLEKYPYIYRAVLKRKLPGTLEIYLEERKPRAVIKFEDLYLVDEHGDIFKKADTSECSYPLLTGLTKEDLYRDSDRCFQIIRTALGLLDRIEHEERFRGSVLEIAMDKNSGLTIITSPERMEVYVGEDDFEEKIKSLWKIVDDLKGRGLAPATIHLKSAQKAYITVKG